MNFSESDDFASRIDALQSGVWDIVGKAATNVASPWVGVVSQLGRNLLRRQSSKYHPRKGSSEYSQDQQEYYQDQPEYYSPYSSYLSHKTGWYDNSGQNNFDGQHEFVF